MISFADGEMLYRLLQSTSSLLRFSASQCFAVRNLPALHEKVEFLAIHQMAAIAQEAVQIERLIASFLQRGEGGDFEQYEI